MKFNKQFAVVTGISRGLGSCFVIELAHKNIGTILGALPEEESANVASESQSFGVESYIHETRLLTGFCAIH